jgi:hypothetical protein
VEREPRTLPDFYIESTAQCGVCQVQNSERPMNNVCSECGEPTHEECGEDTEPSGGWDRDYDVNYWVCKKCLDAGRPEEREQESSSLQDDDSLGDLGDHPF